MDLAATEGDLDLSGGVASWVTGAEAIRQDIELALATWLGETPYDMSAGLPYVQVIFQKGTSLTAVRFIVEQALLARKGVVAVLELNTELNRATRELTITGRVKVDGSVVDFGPIEVAP